MNSPPVLSYPIPEISSSSKQRSVYPCNSQQLRSLLKAFRHRAYTVVTARTGSPSTSTRKKVVGARHLFRLAALQARPSHWALPVFLARARAHQEARRVRRDLADTGRDRHGQGSGRASGTIIERAQ